MVMCFSGGYSVEILFFLVKTFCQPMLGSIFPYVSSTKQMTSTEFFTTPQNSGGNEDGAD
jgi:hypothetical protein